MNYMQNLMQLRGCYSAPYDRGHDMYRYIITLLLLCCVALPATADDVQLQENHPDRYVVVKGDTLWGISGRFLKNPWLWPKVWKMNRAQIKNPHLIYPGDVVVLDTSSGQPQLRLLRETVTLQPGIREEALEKEAIPTIAPNIIAPFLSQPLVIENGELEGATSIISGQENRVVLSPGVKIYADKIEENDGLFWHVYRSGNPFIDPETKETLGIEAVYLGDAKVLKYGEPATAEIARAKEEIFIGDKLVPAPETLFTSFVPRAPEEQVKGQIMTVYSGVAEAGPNSIVTINRGSTNGLEQGHVLAINRLGKLIKNPNIKNGKAAKDAPPIKLPDERIGLLMVFRTFDRVSYGLIMQASEPVNVLDVVQNP